jgi:hypothetical protein
MRMPDPGPFGDTFFEARLRAIVEAFSVKSFSGGCVESVVTFATQRFLFVLAIQPAGNQWQILGCNRPAIVAFRALFLLIGIRNFATTLQCLPDARD